MLVIPAAFMKLSIIFGLLGFLASVANADSELSHPQEPLTLAEALQFADTNHPHLNSAELSLQQAQTDIEFFSSSDRLKIDANFVARHVDRADYANDVRDDSYAQLQVSHPIYDFGRRQAATAESEIKLGLATHELEYQRQLRRLEIVESFLSVLHADLNYGVEDEKMTIAFLRFNRMREETDLFGSHSEVDVLEHETIYRERFLIRQQAGMERQTTRRQLGLSLGFVDYVPRDLISPDLSAYVTKEVPEYEELLEQVLTSSFAIKNAKLELQQKEAAALVNSSKYKPMISATIEATEWAEPTGSRNSAAAFIQMRVPLYSGAERVTDRKRSELAIEQAQINLEKTEYELRMRVFELWKQLQLYHLDYAAAETRTTFRDQYMDRSRTLYELEERSDLGDAQAELLRSLYELQRIEHGITLIWAHLDVMLGKIIFDD